MLNRSLIRILAVFGFITLIFMWTFNETKKNEILRIVKKSFITPTFLLEDIDEAATRPSLNESDRQIFFIETTCAEKCECAATLDDRKICAIESTARLHPTYKVYVLIVNSEGFKPNHKIDLIERMFEYENVYLRKVNLTEYSKNTPLEQFFATKRYVASGHMRTHLSDILRMLTLYKYGGIYLDSDIVCLKNMQPLGMNFASGEAFDVVTGSMINFGNDALGRSFASQCVEELNNTFDGSQWAINGPGLITRVLNRLCNTNFVSNMTKEACSGFQVLPRETFAPVAWQVHHYYFKEENMYEAMKCTENAYIAHIFNHMNSEMVVVKKTRVAYALLAKEYCPDMFNSKGKCF